ncbi:MAG: hypothetical protein Q7W02_19050 [Candidatus Rokubacteria bacterium]|nr:hypothetical protein [Candidatus Rokubacteria bacterium]
MRAIRLIAVVLALALALPAAAGAASWGGIEPGDTTLEQVRERYGAPSKETKQKIESYDTMTWIYEGPKAPGGIKRMVVEFGILKPDGFKPNVVRVFVLEPRPSIFAVQTVIDGWGLPSAAGDQSGFPTMLYEAGLLVVFDKRTLWAESMTFTLPQPLLQAPAAGAAPAPAPAPPKAPTTPKPGSTSPAGPRP